MKRILGVAALIILFSCEGTRKNDKFAICNDLLENCFDSSGDYCLLGFKWGNTSTFSPAGSNVIGPKEAGGSITFSFQESNGLVNTHAQVDLPSKSFNQLISCSKAEIRRALETWEIAADLSFVELPENSNSDIRFFTADIITTGVGFPNFQSPPCIQIGGDIIIQSNSSFDDCESFYIFVLHEIGHTLGLGHVSTKNIMNPNVSNYNFTGLQNGDIRGIKELYGEK